MVDFEPRIAVCLDMIVTSAGGAADKRKSRDSALRVVETNAVTRKVNNRRTDTVALQCQSPWQGDGRRPRRGARWDDNGLSCAGLIKRIDHVRSLRAGGDDVSLGFRQGPCNEGAAYYPGEVIADLVEWFHSFFGFLSVFRSDGSARALDTPACPP